jgi:cell division protein FtsI (penicillin-binding protein 3)
MTKVNRMRLIVLAVAVLGMAGAVGARLCQLQIQRCDGFRARAQEQHQRRIVVQATRGAIVDRHGTELAISVETQSLFAHPWRVEEPERAADLLAPVIGVSRAKLLEKLRSDKSFVYLSRFLDAEKAEEVRTLELPLGENLPFGFDREPKRVYPRGRAGVHVVGYATIDGDGVEGVERQLDYELKGDPTVYLAMRDARNGRLRQLVRGPEKQPLDVVLTLDIVLQHIVERELDRAMRETGARAASAILLDPSNGQVLALANRPVADPNRYGSARDDQRVNRALVHFYEPGSTFKIVPMAAALDRGVVRTSQLIHCENGRYSVGPRQIHDVTPHQLLTPRQILEKSSNIGMVKVVQALGRHDLYDSITAFGFGLETGIELPGESPGSFAPVARWSGFTQASLAFGQEIGVTPLQMASALSAIANDGVRVAPRVVLGTRDAEGRLRRHSAPQGTRVISAGTAREITEMMEAVVERGTGRRAAIDGYRLAGKSGTAQKATVGGYSETEYIASFGGFGPVSAPRLVGLVVLDSPRGDRHQGGKVAGPVFGRIMVEALRHLRAPQDSPSPPAALSMRASQCSANGSAPRSRTAGPLTVSRGVMPDVRGLSLRRAVAALSAAGCRSEVRGTGTVGGQRPGPGDFCLQEFGDQGDHSSSCE